jgi:hypothetical protein
VSPSIGRYQLVNAGAFTLSTTVAGTALPNEAITLAAGADMTVLVTGTSPATSIVNPISDDNRLPTTSSRFKVRLVHAAPTLAERPVTMAINSSQVVSNLDFGSASEFETETAVNDARLELSEPLNGIFYSDAQVDFITGSVYTVFVFDYADGPSVVLTTGR